MCMQFLVYLSNFGLPLVSLAINEKNQCCSTLPARKNAGVCFLSVIFCYEYTSSDPIFSCNTYVTLGKIAIHSNYKSFYESIISSLRPLTSQLLTPEKKFSSERMWCPLDDLNMQRENHAKSCAFLSNFVSLALTVSGKIKKLK